MAAPVVETRLAGGFLAEARRGGDGVEGLEDARAERAPVFQMHAEGVRGGDSALAVGGAGQRHADLASRHLVQDLDHVARRVDARVGGPELVVDLEAARAADRQASGLGERELGPDADRKQDDAGVHDGPVRQLGLPVRPLRGTDRLQAQAGYHPHAPFLELGGDHRAELRVHRRHDPRQELDDRGRQAALAEGLGHLEADEASPAISADLGDAESK